VFRESQRTFRRKISPQSSGLKPKMKQAARMKVTRSSVTSHGGGEGRPARKADNLTAICEPIV
jgi:hypothetical protein